MREPSIKETAFSCPHCDAYTTQYWHNGYVKYIPGDLNVPIIPDAEDEKAFKENKELKEDVKRQDIDWIAKMRAKLLFPAEKTDYGSIPLLNNLFLSLCYNSKKWSIWVNEDIVYPPRKFGSPPNQNLPQNILAVVEEARSILDASPKGAAALLRLSIQMLCMHLGEDGENLNNAIANLVNKGLNPVAAKSLDVVRVIGNAAVHPGFIDLNDDKDTAKRLFDLINIIAEQMISHPKHVDELYGKLPESKRKAIEVRNEKALSEKEKK